MSNLYYDPGEGVMLATTAYDSPDASYTYSIAQSREYLHKHGIKTAYLLLQGNCHVDDARNTVVRDFLASNCDELVFLDADVSWEPEHLLALCRYDVDLVGGVYPYRRETGKEKMPVRNIPGIWQPDENGLLEVDGLPTGFLKIKRPVLEKMAKTHFDKGPGGPVPLIFERDIMDGGRRGGDIAFCMKWREMGGKCYAAANLRLGHSGKMVIKDSLAASLRRQTGTTLEYVAGRIKEGDTDADLFHEAIKLVNNPWGAQADVLSMAVLLAGKCAGPILEAGSGLTTVLMAAATEETVWCLEHSQIFAQQTEYMARCAGVRNIAIVTADISDGWYDLSEDLPGMPEKFALGVIDGPPRLLGDRMKFFDAFGDKCEVFLADDADDGEYSAKLQAWAEGKGHVFEADNRAAVITPRKLRAVA